jgi:predicted O-methyltransferase YrrM
MPVTPNFMERMILLKLHKGPGPLLDLLGAWAFKAVSVAVKLDIFESLSSGPLTATEIAHRMKASERGIQLLLNALESIGYVKQQGGRYSNTPMTAKWMVRSSPHCIADAFPYFNDILEIWGDLDEAIRRGETPTLAWEWLDQHPDGWNNYNAAMVALARMAVPEVIAKVKLPVTARRLLDVGGSHGLYSINFCSRYPDLSATILDGPPTRKLAEANIAAAGMEKRVSFREGDFWTDDLGSGYDVALLFNIIHMYLPDKNIELLKKVGGALNTGGAIVIMDQMATPASAPTAKAMAGLTGLNLFVNVNGQTYPPKDVAGWLRQAGLTNPREIFLRKSPGIALVVGTKAS